MKTLVTGATGQIGRRFVRRLLDDKQGLRVLVRDEAWAEPLRGRGAETVVGDLRDAGVVARAIDGVDAVIHLAAAFRGVDDEEAFDVNERATVELARQVAAAGIAPFVFASTNLVYGGGRGRPSHGNDEPAPGHAYPQSKAAAERALLQLHDRAGLGARIARFAFVYGEGDPHLEQSLLWAREWPLHKRMHLVHHADVAQALRRLLHSDGVDGRIFNIGDDAPVSALELFELNGEEPPRIRSQPRAAERHSSLAA
jgi:nucleoside-diphosphate-sugar epimerase